MSEELKKCIVRLVDDDDSLLRAQKIFLSEFGWNVVCYRSALEFLEQDDFSRPGCLVLDVRMPQMTGIELQREIKKRDIDLPIIFLSAHGDIEMAVEAVQNGAKTFLVKPPRLDKLLEIIEESVKENIQVRKEKLFGRELKKQWDTLTPKEKQVAQMAGKGLTTGTIAQVLGMSERSVRSHRSDIYEKLDLENVAELTSFLIDLQEFSAEGMS